ncbi:hypothetical protein A2733_01195 [Candidatus Nomurabacteria bacterium RIFCSPHIGHO2_01_FULL_40_20]|uniref:Amino acid transporter n=1 Tax=Candidatus Nomurabacteria bacterium RIFCSPHIGHO2_01_FULL_40_20 TaxID=1801738 RepID=A0A1F6V452_9BACT|nr:MAG: hypothetical protein A2733_01195 [Candidatus Nomurabacteria bacterium RIFCSPHIGHO2_01_FULL_40_20]
MTPFLAQFAVVVIAHLLAVMSPGPDFIVVSRNSLSYSRKIGIYTALGVALGISVHVFYSLAGVGLVISKSIVLFNIIKVLGAIYLLYLGYKMLKSQPSTDGELEKITIKENADSFSPFDAIKNGFLVNVLNPKATLFFVALFTQVVGPATPQFVKVIYGVEMMFMTFVWFTIVSFLFSHKVFQKKIFKWRHIIDRAMGAVLVAIGIKVLVSR